MSSSGCINEKHWTQFLEYFWICTHVLYVRRAYRSVFYPSRSWHEWSAAYQSLVLVEATLSGLYNNVAMRTVKNIAIISVPRLSQVLKCAIIIALTVVYAYRYHTDQYLTLLYRLQYSPIVFRRNIEDYLFFIFFIVKMNLTLSFLFFS